MLSCSEELPTSHAFCFWHTREGTLRFANMVRDHGIPIDEDLANEVLLQALLGGATWTDAEVNGRVLNAMDRLLDRLVFMGRRSEAFERFLCEPQPARHAIYAGKPDRDETREHRQPVRGISTHFGEWQDRLSRHRAFGTATRDYYGVRK